MDSSFWNGKKVLVTGHTGFKGSWLSIYLQMLGADVVGYARKPHTTPSLFETASVARGLDSVNGDVRDLDSVLSVFGRHRPEIVIHMAAQALVHESYRNPIETYTTNVIGTANVLEAVRRSEGIRAVVCITSDKCYANKEWLWGYRETDQLGGKDPYSSSKACAELVIAAYRSSYFPVAEYTRHGVAVGSTRAGNVIGGGDWSADRLIPDLVRAFSKGEAPLIRKPEATRPWQFVLEPIRGYLMLGERLWTDGPAFADAWNFAPSIDDAKPVEWMADRLTGLWGEDASWKRDGAAQPPEDTLLRLDSTKARSLLDWTTRLPLTTVLEWIVEWYQAYNRNQNMREITELQISRYEDLGA